MPSLFQHILPGQGSLTHLSKPDLSPVLQIPNIQIPTTQAPCQMSKSTLPSLSVAAPLTYLNKPAARKLSSTPRSPLHPVHPLVIPFLSS